MISGRRVLAGRANGIFSRSHDALSGTASGGLASACASCFYESADPRRSTHRRAEGMRKRAFSRRSAPRAPANIALLAITPTSAPLPHLRRLLAAEVDQRSRASARGCLRQRLPAGRRHWPPLPASPPRFLVAAIPPLHFFAPGASSDSSGTRKTAAKATNS